MTVLVQTSGIAPLCILKTRTFLQGGIQARNTTQRVLLVFLLKSTKKHLAHTQRTSGFGRTQPQQMAFFALLWWPWSCLTCSLSWNCGSGHVLKLVAPSIKSLQKCQDGRKEYPNLPAKSRNRFCCLSYYSPLAWEGLGGSLRVYCFSCQAQNSGSTQDSPKLNFMSKMLFLLEGFQDEQRNRLVLLPGMAEVW